MRELKNSTEFVQARRYHRSEWSYGDPAAWSGLEKELGSFLDSLKDKNTDRAIFEKRKKQEIATFKEQVEKLGFWSDIKIDTSAEEGEEPLAAFPSSPYVYHFHPLGFIRQMKKVSNCIIRITRKWEYQATTHESSSTVGVFTIDNADISGYILEPYGESTTESGKDKRIPPGEYRLTWHTSTKFSKDKYSKTKIGSYLNNGFPKVFNDNVSQSRGILIHGGSKGEHTEGCLLPGDTISTIIIDGKEYVNSVKNSIKTFYKLIEYIEKHEIENIRIIITENYGDYK